MTELLIFGSGVLIVIAALWLTIRQAREAGEVNARLEQTKRDFEGQKKAGSIVAEHRTTDDTVDKLSDGKF